MRRKVKPQRSTEELPVRDMSIIDVQTAVREYSRHLPEGVHLRVLIEEDLHIDYELLAPYLGAIPSKTYYMSKETYELFEEEDYELAKELDEIQRAVDKYEAQTGELPVIPGDPYRKVSFYKLNRNGLLASWPKYEYYLTDEMNLITHKRPN